MFNDKNSDNNGHQGSIYIGNYYYFVFGGVGRMVLVDNNN